MALGDRMNDFAFEVVSDADNETENENLDIDIDEELDRLFADLGY